MKVLGWIGLGVVALVGLWWWSFPSATVRYRLTYEVEVDGKVHSSSSVVQAGMYDGFMCGGMGSGGHPCWSFTGEAVAVDLGARGVLFSLLAGPSKPRGTPPPTQRMWLPASAHVQFLPVYVMLRAGLFPTDSPRKDNRIGHWLFAEKLRTTVDLVPYEIPELVRFRDLTDPTTAEIVDPGDLAASFGSGVRLVRATITYVSAGTWPLTVFGLGGEPITRGIEARMPGILAGVEKYNRMVIDPRNPQDFNPNTGHFVRK